MSATVLTVLVPCHNVYAVDGGRHFSLGRIVRVDDDKTGLEVFQWTTPDSITGKAPTLEKAIEKLRARPRYSIRLNNGQQDFLRFMGTRVHWAKPSEGRWFWSDKEAGSMAAKLRNVAVCRLETFSEAFSEISSYEVEVDS